MRLTADFVTKRVRTEAALGGKQAPVSGGSRQFESVERLVFFHLFSTQTVVLGVRV